MKILLASNSPRRKEILTEGKIDFTVVKSGYKEESFKFYNESFIKKNSLNKALDAARGIDFPAVVIGADTMVILREGNSDVCLLKPQSYDEAFLMLKKLSGKTHKVVTSISLVKCPTEAGFKENLTKETQVLTEIEETYVTFRKLSDDEIHAYLELFKPLDKAGSYGIQDFLTPDEVNNPPKKSFIEKIEGDYFNVMGISLEKLKSMLEKFCPNALNTNDA